MEGMKLFKANCGACHKVDAKLVGPALANVWERWESEEKLIAWIKNSSAVIASGDPYANKIFNEYGKSVMTAFPSLTNEQILSIIDYTRAKTADPNFGNPPGTGSTTPQGATAKPNNSLWYIVAGFLLVLALGLIAVTRKLDDLVKEKEGEPIDNRPLLQKIFTRRVKSALILLAILAFGANIMKGAIGLGRSQGYKPEQPIKFSHALHAGQNKIDCQYCHSGAEKSRHAVIPSVNVCMNCHKYVSQGPKYGKKEIAKIYKYSGWDPTTGTFANQPKPIEWVKVHNLPDHVYFNHSQHVKVGGIECQTCHGNIQEMEEVQQFAPLSMGWCINCHRQTEVKFSENKYYSIFDKYHDDIKSGKKDKVTVEDIGGAECQKCHY
ncbi:MAG: c-type cytochrome [Chitinophagales bacterium]|nr:c-type cytochrome [Chitinophagales bacterium]